MSAPEIVIDWLGGNCPVQARGTIDGKPFYFRARYDSWILGIGGDDVIAQPEWQHEQDYGDHPFDADWMTHEEAAKFIVDAAFLYAERHKIP